MQTTTCLAVDHGWAGGCRVFDLMGVVADRAACLDVLTIITTARIATIATMAAFAGFSSGAVGRSRAGDSFCLWQAMLEHAYCWGML